MPNYVPVSKSKHANSSWMEPKNYNFAAKINMVPILIEEIVQAIPALPFAFRKQKDAAGKDFYELVAFLSPVENRNLFVKPDGEWLSDHVPVFFRGYPFRLMTTKEDGQQVVCFDQDSGLLTEAGAAESNPFFEKGGKPSKAFLRFLEFLQQYEKSRQITQKAVDLLVELNLLVPWDVVLKDSKGKEMRTQGLFKINAVALQKLAAEPLHKLNQCGALPMAYAQLLSEQRVHTFGELLRTQSDLKKKKTADVTMGNIEALFKDKSGMINFDKF